ncbi:MAG: dihydroorotate dehydrogenase [Bacteroidetes bacterium]|nr:dihydroorotate dehydrogenase [Rhodothermia bacterium]MCX7906527.1 dihydroorotate dehydrogenase [Bacteroidota bacterium]MDW8284938.1 dihydroorotate dehydrogenase [Bacteroidota bacterium]
MPLASEAAPAVRTEVDLGRGLRLKNRVLVASGTFAYADTVGELVDVSRLGGVVTKAISLEPREGNPPPRIVEVPGGLLNAIGLANVGARTFVRDKLPRLRQLDTAIVVNVVGFCVEDYVRLVRFLDEHEGIDAYEVNLSCPNVKEGGACFADDPMMTRQVVRALRPVTDRHLMIKLSPNVARIGQIARICEEEGADSVSLINTLVGMAVDVRTRRPKLANVTGGYSGPAIKPVALAKVWEAYRAVRIPIIGIGGIMSAEDALEFLLVGAQAVQVGTGTFVIPDLAVRIVEGMEAYARSEGLRDIGELVGALRI